MGQRCRFHVAPSGSLNQVDHHIQALGNCLCKLQLSKISFFCERGCPCSTFFLFSFQLHTVDPSFFFWKLQLFDLCFPDHDRYKWTVLALIWLSSTQKFSVQRELTLWFWTEAKQNKRRCWDNKTSICGFYYSNQNSDSVKKMILMN